MTQHVEYVLLLNFLNPYLITSLSIDLNQTGNWLRRLKAISGTWHQSPTNFQSTCSALNWLEIWWPHGYHVGLQTEEHGFELDHISVLCLRSRHFSLTAPLSTQEYLSSCKAAS